MRTSTLLTICALTILVGAGCSKKEQNPANDQIQPTAQQQETQQPDQKSVTFENADASPAYTMDEVSKHTTPEDCWFVIADKVYDASNAGTKHPGGDAVYQGCGKDATTLFETRPMGSGTPHSEKARGYLKNYEIGTLQK